MISNDYLYTVFCCYLSRVTIILDLIDQEQTLMQVSCPSQRLNSVSCFWGKLIDKTPPLVDVGLLEWQGWIQSMSTQMLLVTCTYLADVIAGVAKCFHTVFTCLDRVFLFTKSKRWYFRLGKRSKRSSPQNHHLIRWNSITLMHPLVSLQQLVEYWLRL
jgi:hypothetical protein